MKKILLIMTDMECGGVQVSLLNFIKALQVEDVQVTLLLDDARGEWFDRIPPSVQVQEVRYPCEGFHKLLRPHRKVNLWQNIIYRIYVHLIDWFYPKKENRCTRYTFLLNHIDVPSDEYDIAIDYHGYGFLTTSILAQKINARYKAAFIHDENMDCMRMAECDLQRIDAFFSVSKSCQRIFAEKFPEYAKKSNYFPNIIDVEDIKKRAEAGCDIIKQPNRFTLVTVGRIMWQKGYDFAVEVAAELKKRNFAFRWYCVGDGLCMDEIKALIHEKDVEDVFVMLGRKDNPYPYIKIADLYVQTSRHEGYGLAIAEALILERLVLSTNLECVAEQITSGENGWIEEMNIECFVRRIMDVMMHQKMYNDLIIPNIRDRNNRHTENCHTLFKDILSD